MLKSQNPLNAKLPALISILWKKVQMNQLWLFLWVHIIFFFFLRQIYKETIFLA